MNAKIEIPNCRSKLLIPSTSYHSFQEIVPNQEIKHRLLKNKKKGKLLKACMLQYVNKEMNDSKVAFMSSLIDLHVEVNNLGKTKSKSEPVKSDTHGIPPILSPFPSPNPLILESPFVKIGYGNVHSSNASYQSRSYRFQPY